MKIFDGKQGVEVITENKSNYTLGSWFFYSTGSFGTGINITVEQFDMIKELVSNPEVVEFYEKLRGDL